jgi:tripartite-type tricarboxylate transporter receptor subunit TctC
VKFFSSALIQRYRLAVTTRSLKRSPAHAFLLGLGLVWTASGAALAQSYPDPQHPIRFVAPTAPGSAVDLLARAYGKVMKDKAGVNSFVENKAGGEGIPGVTAVTLAPADGYTILITSSSFVVLNSVMLPKITTYDPLRDLTPIASLSKAAMILTLGANAKFKTAREFIAAARQNPGKYTCASSSTTTRMGCEYLQVAAGIKLLIVPYKATAAAVMALGAGEVDAMIADAGSFQAGWDTGRSRPVAVMSEQRLPTLPNVPTAREEGVPELLMSAWYGVFFKAGTDSAKMTAMQKLFQEASESPEVREALKQFVHEPFVLVGDAMAKMHRAEIERWNKMVSTNGIKFAD